MAFELEGFTIVRGPDLLWGGDIRRFFPPAGVAEQSRKRAFTFGRIILLGFPSRKQRMNKPIVEEEQREHQYRRTVELIIRGIQQQEISQGFETVEVERDAVCDEENGCAPVQIRINVIALLLKIHREIKDAYTN